MIIGRCVAGFLEAQYGPHCSSYILTRGGASRVVCGRYPKYEDALRGCFRGGDWVFFDLTQEPLDDYREAFHRLNPAWRFFSFPILDDHPPASLSQYLLCVDLLEGFRLRGYNVYLHCRGGIGRTGTVALGWIGRWAELLISNPNNPFWPQDFDNCHTGLNYLRECDVERGWRNAPEVRQVAWLRSNWGTIVGEPKAKQKRLEAVMRLSEPRG